MLRYNKKLCQTGDMLLNSNQALCWQFKMSLYEYSMTHTVDIIQH